MTFTTAVRAPETLVTTRLHLRRPAFSDAADIFSRYASDPAVTRYLSWPSHRHLEDTRAYLAWSDRQWERWPAGPFLVFPREPGGALLGSTGLAFHGPQEATTGYVLARDAWGHGYATECLEAMITLARRLGVRRLTAMCHVEHTASAHVMEKCGMHRNGILRENMEFPNLAPGVRQLVLRYSVEFPD
jgi:RimJ/RimL family protein N-acetyltransferase